MRNLSALGALLVIFVGSFYMGRATSHQKDVKVVSSHKKKQKPPLKKNVKRRAPQSVQLDKGKVEELKRMPSKEKVTYFMRQKKYKEIMDLMELENVESTPLLEIIIGLEEDSVISHDHFVRMKNNLLPYLKNYPDKAFSQILNVVKSTIGRENPSLRGNLMVAASFIPGKEDEVIDMALEELKTNTVKEVTKQVIPGQKRKVLRFKYPMNQVATVKAYEAYLSAAHLNLEKVQDETLEILKFQTNLTVRRNLAIIYDRTFPQKRNEMLMRMKEEGINLMRREGPQEMGAGYEEEYDDYYNDQEDV